MTQKERDALIAAVRKGCVTPEQRDELARLTGATIQPNSVSGYYRWPDGSKIGKQWLPEVRFDDCRPLFAEIERRVLWRKFESIAMPPDLPSMSAARFWLYLLTPADIVAAFLKTVEAKN